MAKVNLKQLALAKLAGFRNKTVIVPEWQGAEVILREPSAEAWLRWQDATKAGEAEELSVSEKALRALRGDVTLFIDVLCNPGQQPVFNVDDMDEVQSVYGPVHSRLLKQALDLVTGAEDVRGK